jgi:hypothetical protein
VKAGAAAGHPSDREAYTRAKHNFVQRVVGAAADGGDGF